MEHAYQKICTNENCRINLNNFIFPQMNHVFLCRFCSHPYFMEQERFRRISSWDGICAYNGGICFSIELIFQDYFSSRFSNNPSSNPTNDDLFAFGGLRATVEPWFRLCMNRMDIDSSLFSLRIFREVLAGIIFAIRGRKSEDREEASLLAWRLLDKLFKILLNHLNITSKSKFIQTSQLALSLGGDPGEAKVPLQQAVRNCWMAGLLGIDRHMSAYLLGVLSENSPKAYEAGGWLQMAWPAEMNEMLTLNKYKCISDEGKLYNLDDEVKKEENKQKGGKQVDIKPNVHFPPLSSLILLGVEPEEFEEPLGIGVAMDAVGDGLSLESLGKWRDSFLKRFVADVLASYVSILPVDTLRIACFLRLKFIARCDSSHGDELHAAQYLYCEQSTDPIPSINRALIMNNDLNNHLQQSLTNLVSTSLKCSFVLPSLGAPLPSPTVSESSSVTLPINRIRKSSFLQMNSTTTTTTTTNSQNGSGMSSNESSFSKLPPTTTATEGNSMTFGRSARARGRLQQHQPQQQQQPSRQPSDSPLEGRSTKDHSFPPSVSRTAPPSVTATTAGGSVNGGNAKGVSTTSPPNALKIRMGVGELSSSHTSLQQKLNNNILSNGNSSSSSSTALPPPALNQLRSVRDRLSNALSKSHGLVPSRARNNVNPLKFAKNAGVSIPRLGSASNVNSLSIGTVSSSASFLESAPPPIFSICDSFNNNSDNSNNFSFSNSEAIATDVSPPILRTPATEKRRRQALDAWDNSESPKRGKKRLNFLYDDDDDDGDDNDRKPNEAISSFIPAARQLILEATPTPKRKTPLPNRKLTPLSQNKIEPRAPSTTPSIHTSPILKNSMFDASYCATIGLRLSFDYGAFDKDQEEVNRHEEKTYITPPRKRMRMNDAGAFELTVGSVDQFTDCY